MFALPQPLHDLLASMASETGYTISVTSSKHANLSRFVVRCHITEACLGGSNSTCADGYTAHRCGQCADAWYSHVGYCMPCGTSSTVYALNFTACALCFLLGLFLLWQLMLDPRVASPIVFLMRLLETLAILNQTSLHWPPAVQRVFALASIVNFNAEIFRFECSTGHPQPLSRTMTAALFPVGAGLIFALAWPLIWVAAKMRSRMHSIQLANLEQMCAKLHPGAPPKEKHTPLAFRPTDALASANWAEYRQIIGAVRTSSARSSVRPLLIEHSASAAQMHVFVPVRASLTSGPH